jgi:hypothetical protein
LLASTVASKLHKLGIYIHDTIAATSIAQQWCSIMLAVLLLLLVDVLSSVMLLSLLLLLRCDVLQDGLLLKSVATAVCAVSAVTTAAATTAIQQLLLLLLLFSIKAEVLISNAAQQRNAVPRWLAVLVSHSFQL